MNQVDRLLGWFEAGTLCRPRAEDLSTVALTRALASLSGVEGLNDPATLRLAEAIGNYDHLVFVLVDGLGLEMLETLPQESFLRQHQALELTSVFPSATASAITSLATGEWPAQHAVPGWWTYLPEHGLTAVALPFLDRFSSRPLSELGITTEVYPCTSLLPRYRRNASCFQPARIADSDYSRYFCGSVRNTGYHSFAQAIDLVLQKLAAVHAPSFTYVYTPSVDEASHAHGPLSPEVREEIGAVDQELARLAAGLGGRARLAVSADHGLIRVPSEHKHVLHHQDPLAGLLRVPPSGEPRAPLFHVLDGERARFQELFLERFGASYALLSCDEVEELELLGPGKLASRTRERVGDFMAISAGPDVLLYRMSEGPSKTEQMIGYHGGLLAQETRIPLVLAPRVSPKK